MMVSTFLFEYLVNDAINDTSAKFVVQAPLLESATRLFELAFNSKSSIGVFAVATVLVALAYVVGHVVASVSALVIDRTLVNRGIGYPSANLLRLNALDHDATNFSRSYYRGAFFWLNASLVLTYIALFVVHHGRFWLFLCAGIVGFLLLAGTLVKLLISARGGDRGWRASWYKRRVTLMKIFAVMFDLIVRPISKIMDIQRSFDDQFLALYRAQFRETFGVDVDTAGTNNFWLCYCYVVERTEHLRSLISFWRTIYTFARNLAASFYLSFAYCFVWLLAHRRLLEHDARLFPFYLPLVLLACSGILAVRYYYIYVSDFNKLVFRAFVTVTCTHDKALPLGASLQTD